MSRHRGVRWPATPAGRVAVTAASVVVGWVAGVALAGGGPVDMLAWLGSYWGVPLLSAVVIYWALPKPPRVPTDESPSPSHGPRRRPGGTIGGVPGGGLPDPPGDPRARR